MQIIYGLNGNENSNLNKDERKLIKSLEDFYNLYLALMSLLIEVHKKAEDYLTKSQNKYLATSEEKNPNRKFINNEILHLIKDNISLNEKIEEHKINYWLLDDEYVDVIFKTLLESDVYKDYMATKISTFKEDKNFVIDFYKQIIAPNDKLYDYIEDKNITWLDDLPVINTTIVKLLKKVKFDHHQFHFVPKLFKDKEDKDFALELLNKTVLNLSKFSEIIAEKTTNWDKDRIANIDFILLQMAICEIQKFPSIPVKVTINEYLEIAKEYSTPKSNVFINGILDKLVREYKDEGILNKTGRGLM